MCVRNSLFAPTRISLSAKEVAPIGDITKVGNRVTFVLSTYIYYHSTVTQGLPKGYPAVTGLISLSFHIGAFHQLRVTLPFRGAPTT